MNTTLEDRIAHALDRRADVEMDVDIAAVRRGARHRRTRRRAGTALAIVVVAGGGVTGIAIRDADPSPVAPAATAPEPPPFGAGALLDPEVFGPPTEVDVDRGATYGVDLPEVDVWEGPDGLIVVNTHPDLGVPAATTPVETAPATTVPVTTTAPPTGSAVDVPGAADGVVEQLADDQWVMYLTSDRERGDFVVARGMTRGDAERAFRSLVDVDGVLQPDAGFQLVDHADAVPASPVPVGWAAFAGFGSQSDLGGNPASYVSVSEVMFGRDSLELSGWPSVMLDIGGREVAAFRYDGGGTSYLWLDASGVFVTAWSFDDAITDQTIGDVVAGTRLVAPAEFLRLAASISGARAAEPVVAQAVVGDVSITLRGANGNAVICAGSGARELCHRDVGASSNETWTATIDVNTDGHWLIAGSFELEPGGYRPDFSDDRYSLPDGTDAPITVVESGGRLWWTVEVPDGIDVLRVDADDTAGLIGTVVRPVVVGPLG